MFWEKRFRGGNIVVTAALHWNKNYGKHFMVECIRAYFYFLPMVGFHWHKGYTGNSDAVGIEFKFLFFEGRIDYRNYKIVRL